MLAMIKFQKVRKRLRLGLSDKAKSVSSSERVSFALQKELEQNGFKSVKAKQARDVGVSYGAAKCRPSELLNSRAMKVKKRISKISRYAKNHRAAKKLFTGSAFAA